ncbi:MAG: PEGA domain-containing protein [Blastocatellia bacterium]
MKCPQCRSEVADWHFYCANCHALVNDPDPSAAKAVEGMVERAGRRLLDLLFGIFIVGLLILMARTIEWKNLLRAIQGNASYPAETKGGHNGRKNPEPSRGPDDSNQNAGGTGGRDGNGKNRKAESVRSMPQTIEELPSPEGSPSSGKVNSKVGFTKTDNSTSATSPEPKSTPKSAPSKPIRPIEEGAQLGVERLESKQDAAVGLIAISSYTPARIYVDGQFSGLTPRTVKLAAGDYQIRLIADGYEDWTRRVKLNSRQQIGIMASMKKKLATQDR